MSEETATTTDEEVESQAVIDATPAIEEQRISKEEAVEFLKEIQGNAGQISEIAMEEENLVTEFFNALLKILKPFSETIEISVSSLPERYNESVDRAYLHFNGELVLVYKSGDIEIINLEDQKNHEILVEITGEIMQKLKTIINSYKSQIEKRVKFLLPITKELQKVAKVFSEG